MTRWLLAFALALGVAPATAMAQASATAAQVTGSAQAEVTRAERAVAAATAIRTQLDGQYQQQLGAVDRLKKQRASWRRDRELKDAMAAAQAQATKVAGADAALNRARTQLATARRTLVVAIDREIAALPDPARLAVLTRQKQQLAPAPRKSVAKIVLPETDIDPLADPEELDAQAKELVRVEQQLANQVAGLERQARELDEQAKLRRQHERAADLARRDDDQPQRNARVSSGGGRLTESDAASDPTVGSPSPPPQGEGNGDGGDFGGGTDSAGGTPPSFEADASVVLSNVVDAATIESLSRASRSRDPAQRALVAKQTRDAVAKRLDQLKKKRAEVEAAARQRRK